SRPATRACACTERARGSCAHTKSSSTNRRTTARGGTIMSASDDGSDGWAERHRQGATFLHGARDLPELSEAQIDRIEQRLRRERPRARRPLLSPALAALVILLAGGVA